MIVLRFIHLVCVPGRGVSVGASGVQKRVLNPLQLELKEVMSYLIWVPGTKPGSLKEQNVHLTTEPSLKV